MNWVINFIQCLGDIQDAMNDYQTAIRLDPAFSLAYYNAANLYFTHRQFGQVTNIFLALGYSDLVVFSLWFYLFHYSHKK